VVVVLPVSLRLLRYRANSKQVAEQVSSGIFASKTSNSFTDKCFINNGIPTTLGLMYEFRVSGIDRRHTIRLQYNLLDA
jgi:hypothetical protein